MNTHSNETRTLNGYDILNAYNKPFDLTAKPFAVQLRGEQKGKKEGDAPSEDIKDYKFVLLTNRTNEEMRKVAGQGKYMTMSVKAEDAESDYQTKRGRSKKSLRGSLKPQFRTIFEASEPEIFAALREAYRNKEFVEIGVDAQGRMVVELDIVLYGAVVNVNTPRYYQTTNDAKGRRVKVKGWNKNDDGTINNNHHPINNSLTNFLFEEEFNKAEAIFAKEIENSVIDNLVGKKETLERVTTELGVKEDVVNKEEAAKGVDNQTNSGAEIVDEDEEELNEMIKQEEAESNKTVEAEEE